MAALEDRNDEARADTETYLEDELDSAEVWFNLVAHSQRMAQQDVHPEAAPLSDPAALPDPSLVIRFAETARDPESPASALEPQLPVELLPGGIAHAGALVLVVEDNPVNSYLVSALLMQEGYEVLLAADALTALGLLGYHHPGLILMDLGLPDMDGLELARRIKGESSTQDIPIVALTAYRAGIFGGSARDAGFVGYVEKPLKPADFLNAVKRYVVAA